MSGENSTKKCPFCAEEIKQEAIFCRYCKTSLSQNNQEGVEVVSNGVKENKATCLVCGEIWHFNKWDERVNFSNSMHNLGSAVFPIVPQRKVVDFNKCPKCGSRAIKIEKVVYSKNNLKKEESVSIDKSKRKNKILSLFDYFWAIIGIYNFFSVLPYYSGLLQYVLNILLSIIFLTVFIPFTRTYIEKIIKNRINWFVKFIVFVFYLTIINI